MMVFSLQVQNSDIHPFFFHFYLVTQLKHVRKLDNIGTDAADMYKQLKALQSNACIH